MTKHRLTIAQLKKQIQESKEVFSKDEYEEFLKQIAELERLSQDASNKVVTLKSVLSRTSDMILDAFNDKRISRKEMKETFEKLQQAQDRANQIEKDIDERAGNEFAEND